MNKKSLKILRYIYRRKSVSHKQLYQKFPHQESRDLIKELSNEFLTISNYEEWEENCVTHVRIGDNSVYRLNSAGEAIVESHRWFNAEYIVSHICIPIVLAVISTLITIFLSNAL